MSESKIDHHGTQSHIEDGEALPTTKEELNAEFKEFNDREAAMTTWQAIKTYRRVLVYGTHLAIYQPKIFETNGLLIATIPFLCGMAYGYDTVASSATTAMPAFLLTFGAINTATNSLYAPSIWNALWTAMSNLGQAIGSFAIGPLAERIGRRYAIVSFALLSCAGVAV
ncbi:hypothetical protein F66182_17226 [Fusarium sp. NRRL 66182]|nr:hypothetical protein F66182_17226 [Fusarium sp. NRRL 66182]